MNGKLFSLSGSIFGLAMLVGCSPNSMENEPAARNELSNSAYTSTPWQRAPFKWDSWVSEISISPDGIPYAVSPVHENGSYALWKHNGSWWEGIYGSGNTISAGPNGELWTVAQNNEVWRKFNGSWTKLGYGRDVVIGANGVVYKIDMQPAWGTWEISVWRGGDYWLKISGAAQKLAVAPNGELWAIAKNNEIWRMSTAGGWTQIPGQARDITVAGDGVVWMLGTVEGQYGYPIYRLNGTSWELATGAAEHIAGSYPRGLWISTKESRENVWFNEYP